MAVLISAERARENLDAVVYSKNKVIIDDLFSMIVTSIDHTIKNQQLKCTVNFAVIFLEDDPIIAYILRRLKKQGYFCCRFVRPSDIDRELR